jgi:hypothetical protein
LVVVLYVYETWRLILREEQTGVAENDVIRAVSGSKMGEATGSWKEFQTKNLHDL